uniref:(northern house mosquito) hypothetical protein n=1 Tax=Culex pipiens TaxID=7175 RepID=A0A8D8FCI9_CULPI
MIEIRAIIPSTVPNSFLDAIQTGFGILFNYVRHHKHCQPQSCFFLLIPSVNLPSQYILWISTDPQTISQRSSKPLPDFFRLYTMLDFMLVALRDSTPLTQIILQPSYVVLDQFFLRDHQIVVQQKHLRAALTTQEALSEIFPHLVPIQSWKSFLHLRCCPIFVDEVPVQSLHGC